MGLWFLADHRELHSSGKMVARSQCTRQFHSVLPRESHNGCDYRMWMRILDPLCDSALPSCWHIFLRLARLQRIARLHDAHELDIWQLVGCVHLSVCPCVLRSSLRNWQGLAAMLCQTAHF